LLLDDVFSEFDREITAKLQGLLEGDRQVFVTSPVPLDWADSQNVKVFEVSHGGVVPAP
jgi:recombinational DNA repair ATPase RecF